MAEINDIISGYASAGPELIQRYEALSSLEVYAPVVSFLPKRPVRMADIGAGTGRDAAWFANQGHHVLAIEPVEEFRTAGKQLHDSPRIEWLDDRLPELTKTPVRGTFDFVTICAVWQHIDDYARQFALTKIASMTKRDGLVIISLRHGPSAEGRRTFPVCAEATISAAASRNLEVIHRVETASVQPGNRASGVSWTWLALRKS